MTNIIAFPEIYDFPHDTAGMAPGEIEGLTEEFRGELAMETALKEIAALQDDQASEKLVRFVLDLLEVSETEISPFKRGAMLNLATILFDRWAMATDPRNKIASIGN